MVKQFKNQDVASDRALDVLIGMKDELSVSARIMYITLIAVDRDQIITYDQLCELTGLSTMTVKRAVKELLEKNLILQTRVQHGAFYTVL